MEYRLHNASIRISLSVVQNITLNVWVDATTNVVRVASSGDAPYKLEATLEIWRNSTGPYPWIKNGGIDTCPSLGEVFVSHPDTVEWQGAGVRRGSTANDASVGANDVRSTANDAGSGLFFYHRNLVEWTTPLWQADLKSQRMPTGGDMAVSPLTNITFGGYLSGGIKSGPMQMVSAREATTQTISIAGIADIYEDVASFKADLIAAHAKPHSLSQHTATWDEFWANADISITAAASPANPDVAKEAEQVTLLDRVNRFAFHTMAGSQQGHAIKFNGYGIYSAYPSGKEDFRVWGWWQWFQNIRLPYVTHTLPALAAHTPTHTYTRMHASCVCPKHTRNNYYFALSNALTPSKHVICVHPWVHRYYHMFHDGRFEDMKSLFEFYFRVLPVSKARSQGTAVI
jgi:hypothetical protein